MPVRVSIEPGLVLALAQLLRAQATTASEAADASAHTAAAVGLTFTARRELDSVASAWRRLGATLETRALLAAGFTLNLPAAHIGLSPSITGPTSGRHNRRPTIDPLRREAPRIALDAVRNAIDGGLSRRETESLLDTFEHLSDPELRSVWAALTTGQRATLLDALVASNLVMAATRLALVSIPATTGRSRLDGANLLAQIAQWLPLIELAAGSNADGVLTYDELVLAATAEVGVLPKWLAFATATFASSPSLFDAVAWSRKGLEEPRPSRSPGPVYEFYEVRNTITVADIEQAVIQIGIVKLLADPYVFDRLDSAKTGAVNGHISIEDVEIAISDRWYGPNTTTLLEHLAVPGVFARLGSTDDRARGTHVSRGSLYWTDVASLAINLHAFASNSADALQFLESLPKPQHDPSGQAKGLDIRLSSDDGVQALASAALAGTHNMVEQTLVIAALPESEGGERNRLITLYYSELGLQMNHVLNRRFVDEPMDPTSLGHSGANWMLMAPWASNSIRPALRGEPVDIPAFFDIGPSTGDRQQLADGNQKIFGDLAPRYAAFIDAANLGTFDDPDSFSEFFESSNLPDGRPMFDTGHNQLRDGFAHLAAVTVESDPTKRQRLTYLSNALLATHEQAAVQPSIAALTDLGVGDDGILRGIGGEIFTYVGGGDAMITTGFMTMSIGQLDRTGTIKLQLSNDIDLDVFANTNNLILHTPLTTTLDPASQPVVEAGETRVHLRGGDEQISLQDLSGWDDPPPAAHRDPFPTSAKTWYDLGTSNVIILSAGEPPVFVTEGRGTPDGNDLSGTGAVDWGNPDDRMWYIANLFVQSHTEPKLWDFQHQVGLDRIDDGSLAFGFVPPAARAQFGGANRRSPQG